MDPYLEAHSSDVRPRWKAEKQICHHLFLFSLPPIMFIWIANTSFFSPYILLESSAMMRSSDTVTRHPRNKEERIRRRRNATSRGNMAPYVYVEANGGLYSHHQPSGYCAFSSLMNWRCVLTPSTWTHPSKKEEFFKKVGKKREERKSFFIYRWCSSNRQEKRKTLLEVVYT